jgi:hypothetical protein
MTTEVRGLLENPRQIILKARIEDVMCTHHAEAVDAGAEVSQTNLLDSPVAVNKQVKGQRLLSIAAEWCLRENLSVVHGRRRMKV